jgi:tetratricopeptide (TPR) repeat protein
MKTKLPLAAAAALLLATFAPAQTSAAPAPDALPGNPAERGVSGTNTGPAAAGNGAALHQQSLENAKQKKFKEAVEFAEQATKADPAKPEYFSQLGVALSQRMPEANFLQMAALSGRMKKAFEKSIELDPNHVAGLIGLTRFYSNAPEIAGGSLVKAGEYATRVRKLNPYLGELELARIAEKAEKPDEAVAHYDAAAQANPKAAGALAAAGRVLAHAGKKDEARARFEAALKINPEHEAAKKGLAELEKPAS